MNGSEISSPTLHIPWGWLIFTFTLTGLAIAAYVGGRRKPYGSPFGFYVAAGLLGLGAVMTFGVALDHFFGAVGKALGISAGSVLTLVVLGFIYVCARARA